MKENSVIETAVRRARTEPAEPRSGPLAPETRHRMAEVDVVRGLAIFGVLVLHSHFTSRFSSQTLAVQATMARMFDWSVLAFFFCSGFLYKKTDGLTATVKKRFVSLIIPFFFYNVFYNLTFAAVGTPGLAPAGRPGWDLARIIGALIWSPAFQLYFLPYLFLVSVGICALDKLTGCHEKPVHVGLLLLTAGFYAWHGYPEISHGQAWEKIPLYAAMFSVGVIARPFFERPMGNVYGIAAGLGIVLCVLAFSRLPIVSPAVPPVLLALVMAAPALARSKLLALMGKMSGSIYVWHAPFLLAAFTMLLARLHVPSLVVLFVSLLLTLLSCLLLRAALDWSFEQVLNRRAPRVITL